MIKYLKEHLIGTLIIIGIIFNIVSGIIAQAMGPPTHNSIYAFFGIFGTLAPIVTALLLYSKKIKHKNSKLSFVLIAVAFLFIIAFVSSIIVYIFKL